MNKIFNIFHLDCYIFRLKIIMAILLIFAFFISSCATKTQTGAIVGGIIGAAVGALVDQDNPLRGAAIGAMVGGGTGFFIGNKLDKKDQESLKKKVVEIAENGRTGETVTWESDHSGASATITPLEDSTTTENDVKENTESIEEPPQKEVSSRKVASANVNVRVGPGRQYDISGVLQKGEEISIVGMADGEWFQVEKDGKVIGYVNSNYLSDKDEFNARTAVSSVGESRPNVKNGSKEKSQVLAKTKNENDVRKSTSTICRPVRVRIKNPNGEIEEQIINTCQGADGSWGA